MLHPLWSLPCRIFYILLPCADKGNENRTDMELSDLSHRPKFLGYIELFLSGYGNNHPFRPRVKKALHPLHGCSLKIFGILKVNAAEVGKLVKNVLVNLTIEIRE